MMNERGKSDRPTVPGKSLNKAGQPLEPPLFYRKQAGLSLFLVVSSRLLLAKVLRVSLTHLVTKSGVALFDTICI